MEIAFSRSFYVITMQGRNIGAQEFVPKQRQDPSPAPRAAFLGSTSQANLAEGCIIMVRDPHDFFSAASDFHAPH